MARAKIVERLGARIYLELGPSIGDLGTARKLAEILVADAESLGMKITEEKKSKTKKS